ncbi:MAG: cytidylate kinase-like family protein [bacterium]|nr:cytidylate kinase-like family protein [bacterium]
MSVITISRTYGSDGRAVAAQVAEKLGYLCMNKDLIAEVAREAQVPISEVERFDEQPEHPALRVLRKFLTPGHPEAITGLSEYEWWTTAAVPDISVSRDKALSILDEEAFVQLTREVMVRLAERGNMILVGRGGSALLKDRLDTLHVRVVAPLEHRIDTTMARDELSRAEALKRIRKRDEQRKLYVKRHYGTNWDASDQFHLTVNTAHIGVNGSVCTIIEALRHL